MCLVDVERLNEEVGSGSCKVRRVEDEVLGDAAVGEERSTLVNSVGARRVGEAASLGRCALPIQDEGRWLMRSLYRG